MFVKYKVHLATQGVNSEVAVQAVEGDSVDLDNLSEREDVGYSIFHGPHLEPVKVPASAGCDLSSIASHRQTPVHALDICQVTLTHKGAAGGAGV